MRQASYIIEVLDGCIGDAFENEVNRHVLVFL